MSNKRFSLASEYDRLFDPIDEVLSSYGSYPDPGHDVDLKDEWYVDQVPLIQFLIRDEFPKFFPISGVIIVDNEAGDGGEATKYVNPQAFPDDFWKEHSSTLPETGANSKR